MEANAAAPFERQRHPQPDPTTLSDGELETELRRLESAEKALSRRRAVLHDRIDFVRGGVAAEIYAAGDQLEVLEQREREVADERRLLHERIDTLRAERGKRRSSPTPG